ncbi:unnamed protein product [Ectocarpus sp. 13 AM-2016]
MADICSADAEAELSSARERARHIGAVLGPSTRELIARMTTAPPRGDSESGDGTDGDDRAGAAAASQSRIAPHRVARATALFF